MFTKRCSDVTAAFPPPPPACGRRLKALNAAVDLTASLPDSSTRGVPPARLLALVVVHTLLVVTAVDDTVVELVEPTPAPGLSLMLTGCVSLSIDLRCNDVMADSGLSDNVMTVVA